jgi:hypothetical protein
MKYQVVIESPKAAIVKATYLNKDFNYIFLDILFNSISPAHGIEDGKGEYIFSSVQLRPPMAAGDPQRHNTIRQEFHRQSDILTTVKASSLEEACTEFFTPFQDTFQIVKPVKAAPKQETKKKSSRVAGDPRRRR